MGAPPSDIKFINFKTNIVDILYEKYKWDKEKTRILLREQLEFLTLMWDLRKSPDYTARLIYRARKD